MSFGILFFFKEFAVLKRTTGRYIVTFLAAVSAGVADGTLAAKKKKEREVTVAQSYDLSLLCPQIQQITPG